MKKNLHQLLILSKRALLGIMICLGLPAALLAGGINTQNTLNLKEVFLNLEFRENTLKEALKILEKETHFNFTYNNDDIKAISPITGSYKEASLYEILMSLSEQGKVKFRQVNDNITVTPKRSPKDETIESIIEQQRITGKVTDEEGAGLPGVNVLVKGTGNGTITNSDGTYSLTISEDDATLIFSFIGYLKKEVPVSGRSVIDITMEPDVAQLSEVVVVGYGTARKSDVTGSLVSVDSRAMEAFPIQNAVQGLQGRAAGVDISSTNFRPGETPSIRIRGNRSLKATNEPLYVIDGVPMAQGASIADFNPLDIESIEILKDASSTAIYGSRGANGVVLVTTKKGKSGRASVVYDGYIGVQSALRTLDMVDGAEFAELKRNAYRTTGDYSTDYPNPEEDYALFGADPYAWESIAMGYEWVDKANRIPVLENGVPVYDPSKVRTTDWQDLVLRNAINQNHQVSISGGNDKMRSLFSFGYLNQEGIQIGQSYERYTFRVNLDYDVTDFLTVGAATTSGFSLQQYGTDIYGAAAGQLPYAVPYDDEGNYIRLAGGDDRIINPIMDDELVDNERKRTRFFGSFYAQLNLLEGLRYRINFGPDFTMLRTGEFQAAASSLRDGSTNWGRYNQHQRFAWTLENLLYYDKSFGHHTFGLTLLQSAYAQSYEETDIRASNLPYDSQKWYALQTTYEGNPESYENLYSRYQIASYMGRLNYAYKGKYLLTVTARYDGSSVLAPGHKWDLFPSMAVGWKIDQEEFFNFSAVNQLKLRYSYGIVGNAALDPYLTGGSLANTNYDFGGEAAKGYAPSTIPNPLLGWEKTAQSNIGLDFGFLGDRIYGSVDVYRATTSDLLMDRSIPSVTGFTSIVSNVGKTRNSGVEVMLSSVNVNTPGGFRWETNITYTKNKEEILELYGEKEDDIANRWFIGQPINVAYGWKFDGIWQTSDTEELNAFQENGTVLTPGMIKVVDVNGDYAIDADDYVVLGSNVPKWTGGISNSISYKGIELSFFVYGRFGQVLYNRSRVPTMAGRYTQRDVDYWTPGNPGNEYPLADRSREFPAYYQALYFDEASFVKVKNITLSYDIPPSWIPAARLAGLNVYVTAFNPILITDYELLDPEAILNPSTQTTDVINGLSTKSFVVGVRMRL